ncbi:hypothetical protein EIKCOROL_00688 [Eikenella corrodens ATCC 23834]|uniref:Uncharacterized protein n=1 Tax=Eikenella corrodens ATCC 23834 TaxID=546274 RepID=C0DTK9_EIKCO|nr:hypothetical protein EIKCOROL_00688 [Eikenella corrodens ATCC 23834]
MRANPAYWPEYQHCNPIHATLACKHTKRLPERFQVAFPFTPMQQR